MKKRISALRNVLLTVSILAAAFGASLLIQHFFREQKVIPALFALAVSGIPVDGRLRLRDRCRVGQRVDRKQYIHVPVL